MIPQVINRFNLYHRGTKLIGITGDVKLPAVKFLTDTLSGAGTGGNLEVAVTGLTDTMDIEIQFMALNGDIFTIMDPTKETDLVLNGAIQGMDNGTGKIEYMPLSIAVRGITKEFDPGTAKSGAKMECNLIMGLSYYKIVLNGKTVLEIDKLNEVCIINGNDVWEKVRNMC